VIQVWLVFLFGSTLLSFNTFISFTILFLPRTKSPPPFDHIKIIRGANSYDIPVFNKQNEKRLEHTIVRQGGARNSCKK
jgi:hypothetical protein